jgi:hypothetical protein
MRFMLLVAFVLASACDSTVETPDGDGSETGRIESPIWGEGEQTAEGFRVPVCVPMENGCLRLSVLINTQGPIDETVVSGKLVPHGCDAADDGEAVTEFEGTAFTGHGTLWVSGDAVLDDGTALELEVEAQQGDCF